MAVTKNNEKNDPQVVYHFKTQYGPYEAVKEEPCTLPSETVPELGLTIKEILARYVRTGTMPVAVHDDQGGNVAFEPDFDPLDANPQELADYRERLKKRLQELQDLEKEHEKPEEKPEEKPKEPEA